MNILIVKLSAIGDVIHALPVSYALRQKYPTAHITWVVEPTAYEIVKHNPCVDEVILFQKNLLKHLKALEKILNHFINYFINENTIFLSICKDYSKAWQLY